MIVGEINIELASLISLKVVIFQLALGGVQFIGLRIGDRIGLIVAFILVILWTLTQTHSSLLAFQLVVQSIILYFLWTTSESGNIKK